MIPLESIIRSILLPASSNGMSCSRNKVLTAIASESDFGEHTRNSGSPVQSCSRATEIPTLYPSSNHSSILPTLISFLSIVYSIASITSQLLPPSVPIYRILGCGRSYDLILVFKNCNKRLIPRLSQHKPYSSPTQLNIHWTLFVLFGCRLFPFNQMSFYIHLLDHHHLHNFQYLLLS